MAFASLTYDLLLRKDKYTQTQGYIQMGFRTIVGLLNIIKLIQRLHPLVKDQERGVLGV